MAEHETISILADPVDTIACRKCGAHLDVSHMPSFSAVVCPQCGLQQMVPALLGTFLLLDLLGVGGMGAVYKALDQALGRYVAIKVMKKAMGNDPQFVDNFLREARAAAAINHRNVVQIYSCGQEKGQPYIVMELVSGGRLDEMIARGDPLDEAFVLDVGAGVAEGLRAAHDIGLVHGDIKPANILFDKEHTPKVADFGLARFIAWQQNQGEVWGTPYYIAPEKARGQKEDHRSDIYSLGATLYHALGAKPPFDGVTATDVVLARLKNPAISIRVIRPELQPETADVVARMLEADPFMRYPTYPSLLADLREAQRVVKQAGGGAKRKPAQKTSLAPVIGLVAGLLVVIIVLLLVLVRVFKGGEEPSPTKPALPPELRVGPAPAAVPSPDQPVSAEPAAKPAAAQSPFTPEAEPVVAAALQQLADGQPDTARRQLQMARAKLAAEDPAALWLQLFEAVSAWSGGSEKEAQALLAELRRNLLAAPEGEWHWGVLAQHTAGILQGEVSEEVIRQTLASGPTPVGDLAGFFNGLAALRASDWRKAEAAFKTYGSLAAAEPAWAYALKPLAHVLEKQARDFRFQQETTAPWLTTGQAGKARAAWEEFQRKAHPVFFALVDAEVLRAREAEAREQADHLAAEQKAAQERIQEDLDKLDAARAAQLPAVQVKDYRTAISGINRLIAEMKTAEGRQVLATLRENYERMEALKKFLVARIMASPFPGAGTELGGDAIGADPSGIRVALGQHGAVVREWTEISVRMYLQLLSHYVADPSLSDAERADLTLSMAVFCYEGGGFRAATGYADQAVKLQPDLKPKVRALMPGIATE